MENKLLVVVDMQNDFIDGSLGSERARSIVGAVKEKINEYKYAGKKIIFTRDTHGEDYLQTKEGKNLPVVHCLKGTNGWRISCELDAEGSQIWDKATFGSAELAVHIAEKIKPDAIELVGLCTDVCVVANAVLLKTFLPEAEISVDRNCCAGITEESHEAALTTMKSVQIKIK